MDKLAYEDLVHLRQRLVGVADESAADIRIRAWLNNEIATKERHRRADIETAEVKRKLAAGEMFTDSELLYAAYARCPCGAGLAYPKAAPMGHYWDCSDILTGRAAGKESVQHTDRLPFAFWEVKGENQPSAYGATTRPNP